MTDLEELRRVLRAREALAPEPGRIAATARERGTRIRRVRAAGAVAGTAVAATLVIVLGASVLGSPNAASPPAGGTATTPVAPRDGGWPETPRYSAPAVPGGRVPGPTEVPTAPVSGRAIDPVVPYSVTLPAGWREASWWYEEGRFRGTWAGTGSTVDFAVLDVLDPATQPAALLRPSGDPATGTPGADGVLAWRADPRHFVRVQLQGEPAPDVFRAVAGTLRFSPRAMIAPVRLDHVPPGLHLSGAQVTFAVAQDEIRPASPWSVTLTFDRDAAAKRVHALQFGVIGLVGDPFPNEPSPNATTVAGHTAAVRALPGGQTLVETVDVGGTDPYLFLDDGVSLAEAGRVLTGLHVVPDPGDTTSWLPLRLP